MAAAVGGWASLKSEAKTLEAYCEMRLNNSAATSSLPSDVESGDPGAVRLREIDDSLSKLTSVIERLGAAATASASSANAAVAQVRVFVSYDMLVFQLLTSFPPLLPFPPFHHRNCIFINFTAAFPRSLS